MQVNEDKEAREQMILDNIPLVWSLVRRFSFASQEKEELFQVGMVGLVHAVDRFDSAYQVKFSTYAVPLILGEIKRFLREDKPIKVTRTIVENRKKIKEMMQENEQVTMEQLARKTGLSTEDVALALGSEHPVTSIYESVYKSDEGQVTLVDQLAQKGKSLETNVEEEQLLQQAAQALNEMEKKLIQMRFYENKTQSQIGEQLSLSQVQVSRLEKKILYKMRQVIE